MTIAIFIELRMIRKAIFIENWMYGLGGGFNFSLPTSQYGVKRPK